MPQNLSAGSLQLQMRDLELLVGLFEARVMTIAHISDLHFGGKREYAKKRLQRLKAAELVSERRRRMNEPSIHFLTSKGFSFLNGLGLLSDFPLFNARAFEKRASVSEMTLSHELEVVDVKATVHAAISKSKRFSIDRFYTWPLLCQFQVKGSAQFPREILVKPDGFLRIHDEEADSKIPTQDCFLEVDRSTESQSILVNRAACYLEHYRSGGYAIRNGLPQSRFKELPFRLLIVLKSAARRNNITERLLQLTPPILTMAWLTTLQELKGNPLGPIWILPQAYREAVAQSPYDLCQASAFDNSVVFARDAFIESKVRKCCLLPPDRALIQQDPSEHSCIHR